VTPIDAWPDGPLLAFVGDDFTGSTDVMEAFTAAGVPTILFLAPPSTQWVRRFAGQRCIGLASTARGQTPQWMDAHLPALFERMKAFGAPILQYKVCSTFDSSPDIGSIGRALDIGSRAMPGRWSPMVVGAPRLKRYQAFGNLFAIADGQGHRLDRHPTMSVHPVTPMNEADLRRHLARQTQRRIELIDLTHLHSGLGAARRDALAGDDRPVVLLDVIDEATLTEAGRLVWQGRAEGLFSASSSGLQYALAAHWRACGLLPALPSLPVAHAVDAIAVVSGSCSPVTAAQIAWARAQGFAVLRMDIARVLDAATAPAEIERLVGAAATALREGRSPVVYSAEGPADPAVTGFDTAAAAARLARVEAAQRVSSALADVARALLDRTPALRRIVVAGGDSSGAVAGALDIAALSVEAGLAPGAPLCRAWSEQARRDGLQIVLKGGQIGAADFFGAVRSGRV
jgi:3-oxoisoapionate kinase